MRSLWWNMLVQPQICFMCGGGGETTGGGGDDGDSGSTTTTTTTTGSGRYEDSRADLEAKGYTVSEDGNSVYSDTGQVAGANWSQGSIDAIVDDDDGGSTTTTQTIQSNDTVSQIALDNNTTIEQIKKDNPGIDINNIKAGETINITSNTRDEGESIYTGATQAELDAGNVMGGIDVGVPGIDTSYADKLAAAGEDDTSTLDEIAAADTTGMDVYEPTQETVTAVEDYYTTGAGATGATQDVDYTQTSSGEDYSVAAQADDTDISGGVFTLKPTEEYIPLSAAEQSLVAGGWTDNGDGTLTSPSGGNYDGDREEKWDWDTSDGYTPATRLTPEGELAESIMSASVGLTEGDLATMDLDGNGVITSNDATLALQGQTPVEVNTFSDQEVVVPAADQTKYDDTILETGTGGISGIRLGDPMTPQLAAELGLSDIYQDGDVILAEDLIKLDELGFDVSQADLSGIDLKTGADAGTITVETGGPEYTVYNGETVEVRELPSGTKYYVDMSGNYVDLVPTEVSDVAASTETVVQGPEEGSMADMQNYIEQLNQQVGGATFEDLEAAGFDLNQIKEYNDTVGAIPGMPVEGTMLYNTLYGEDQGVYAGVEGGGEPGDAFDYEDYITQGGQFPLGGDDGLPEDFFSTETPDTITLNGQQYAVGYAEGAIDPGIANEIRRAELDGFTTPQVLGNIAKAATSPIFQSLGMSVEGLARTGDTTVEAVVEAIQDSDNPIDFLNTFSTRVGEGARDVIYNLVGTENVPTAVTDFFGEEGSEAAPRPADAEDFEFNMLNTLASNVYEPLYFIEEEIYNSIPSEFREGMEANQLVGDFQDLLSGNIRTADGKTFLEAMKDSPGETSAQLLSNIGDVASDLLVLAITRSPGATALFGFGEGSQDARNSFQADLIQQATTGSLKDDPAFKALIQSEGSVENAVAALSDKFEKYAITAGGVEGVSDMLIYGVGGKLATKVLPNKLTQGALGTGLGVTAAAGTEGATEGVQQFVSNVGVNDVLGVDLNTGRDVGTAFINALVPGAAAGIISAATTRYLSPKEVADIITNVESSTGQDLSALQAMLTSSDSIAVTTDSDGNLQFTNTQTGQAVTMPTASKVGAGAAAGTETNVTDITAAEILNSGNEIEYTTDNEGNSILTDKVTGDSVNLGTGSVVSDTDTTKVTGVAGVTGAAGITGAQGAEGAQGASSTTTTLSGSSSVETVGDVEITTTVDNQGNTTVTTKNVVTGTTTADVVPAGTTSVITNGTSSVVVDTTTASTTGAITTVVDPTIDTTTAVDTTSAIDTTSAVDTTTATTSTTPIVSTTTSTTGDDDEFVATSDVVDTPTDTFTPDDGGDDDVLGETDPGYTSGIAGLGGGVRPVVAPYYQPQQTGQYTFYVPQPGVTQTPAQPVFTQPTSYLAPTAQPQYGYGYIAPNTDIEYLRRLAEIQGTGAEKLPSEDLMDGS